MQRGARNHPGKADGFCLELIGLRITFRRPSHLGSVALGIMRGGAEPHTICIIINMALASLLGCMQSAIMAGSICAFNRLLELLGCEFCSSARYTGGIASRRGLTAMASLAHGTSIWLSTENYEILGINTH